MTNFSNSISRVAVISPCQMEHVALQALFLGNEGLTLAWHDTNYELKPFQEQPVDLLIVSLHVYQPDLQQGMWLLETLQATYPDLQLLVVLDVAIPYLMSCLQGRGISNIVNLKLSVVGWRKKLLAACDSKAIRPEKCQFTSKRNQLTPMESCIMRYLLQGVSVQGIASLMACSTKNISSQKNRALHKMGINHYTQLVAVKAVFMDNLNITSETCPIW
ncbi:Capsular synthesis regulator component B [Serratia fonticola]|uniref:LuxR C-terminal-related transcriptional regulator n=1 Tax=Serratia fonticola TaxID=47917 RepID=UPI00217CABDD|nr:LuxR C-terminal-related transcriptional regulator [Serratia fonticola]CAI1580347.1 Capsular synthesis regulator component B [Serratia fonticola]